MFVLKKTNIKVQNVANIVLVCVFISSQCVFDASRVVISLGHLSVTQEAVYALYKTGGSHPKDYAVKAHRCRDRHLTVVF